MNDLPVGRSVDEALRLVQAFQFTVCFFCHPCVVDGVLIVVYVGQAWRSVPRELEGGKQDYSCRSPCETRVLFGSC